MIGIFNFNNTPGIESTAHFFAFDFDQLGAAYYGKWYHVLELLGLLFEFFIFVVLDFR